MRTTTEPNRVGRNMLDVEAVRREFPILHQSVHGKPLVYLDNAATSQKPQCVIDAMSAYYANDNANVHRGVHELSNRATHAYEAARGKAQRFLNAATREEIVFVRGTTEAVNLVAQSFVRPRLTPGDEILITELEHHSNIVPWQMLCKQTGAVLRVAPINDRGELIVESFEKLLTGRTRFVAVSHVSNALGTISPVEHLCSVCRECDVPILIDGAQAVPHMSVDVRALGCDFYAFSSHKVFGPTGVGVLYGRKRLLDAMPPYQGGGEMIKSVTFEETIYHDVPHKFEAGTPNIGGVIGLGAALDYVSRVGHDAITAHERALLARATEALQELPGITLIGTAERKASVVSFVLDGVHPHDVGSILDQQGIAVRTGHHCAQPVMEHFGIPASVRASMAFYNTLDEIDQLAAGIRGVAEVFR